MLVFLRVRGLACAIVAVTAVFLFGAPVSALPQFSPVGTERAHTVGNGAGIEWDTQGGGSVAYDSGTETVTVSGRVDVLNYFDPTNGSCATDTAGSTCSLNYSPDLDLSVTAKYSGLAMEHVFGDFYNIILSFETTGGAYDLLVTDPADSGNTMITGSFVSGAFGGDATTGLETTILYDIVNETAAFQSVTVAGFMEVDSGTLHASLFNSGSDYFGLGITDMTGFDDGLGGGLDEIVAAALADVNNALPDFSVGTVDGEVFRITSGEFVVPEPSTALLLGFGLTILAARRSKARN